MSKWKNRTDYWASIEPRIDTHLVSNRRPDVANALNDALAFFSFVSEDLSKKITANQSVSPKLDLFVVFAHDQLRAAPVLYKNLNLSPAAISARATFENCVSLRFIVKSSDAAKLADMYNRFREILRIKAHRNSPFLGPLPAGEEAKILAANPEWCDPITGKLVDKPHWSGKKGITFEQMVQQLGMKDYYSLYRTTSNFVHASPVTLNLYWSAAGLGSIATEIQARRMALLIAIFALETLIDYCIFFGVNYEAKDHKDIVAALNSLTN